MGVFLALFTAVMWSAVGTLVKYASGAVSSYVISFLRFLFGVLILLVVYVIARKKPHICFDSKWVYIGAAAKALNYICENAGISRGMSYGNILVFPASIIVVLVASLLMREKHSKMTWIGAALCLGGIAAVVFSNANFSGASSGGYLNTLLFLAAGIGAGVHMVSQKKLLEHCSSLDMNLSVFALASLFSLPSAVIGFEYNPPLSIGIIAALVATGAITALSFLTYAAALKRIPFILACIITNSSVLFTLLWGALIYHDTIPPVTVIGAVIFLAGIVISNIKTKESKA